MRLNKITKIIALVLILSLTGGIVASRETAFAKTKKASVTTIKGTIEVGEKVTLYVDYNNKRVSGKKCKWSVNKAGKSIISINKSGVIKGKKAGKATVTAKYKGYTIKYKITVKEASKNYELEGLTFKLPDCFGPGTTSGNVAVFGVDDKYSCLITVADLEMVTEEYGLDDTVTLDDVKELWDGGYIKDSAVQKLVDQGAEADKISVTWHVDINNTFSGLNSLLKGNYTVSAPEYEYTEQGKMTYYIVNDKLVSVIITDLSDSDSFRSDVLGLDTAILRSITY